MCKVVRIAAVAALAGLAAGPAWAYVGPGAGLSLLAAFWTLLTAIVMAVGFVVMWPLRRRLRRARRTTAQGGPGDRGDPRKPGSSWRTPDEDAP